MHHGIQGPLQVRVAFIGMGLANLVAGGICQNLVQPFDAFAFALAAELLLSLVRLEQRIVDQVLRGLEPTLGIELGSAYLNCNFPDNLAPISEIPSPGDCTKLFITPYD